MAQNTSSKGERGAVVGKFAADQQQVDLAHEFVAKAQGEVLFGHLLKRGEGHIAGGANQRIEFAGLFEQAANRSAIADIDLEITAGAADAHDFVALGQFLGNCRTDGAVGADQEDFH
ncbi:hypothetical protein D3C85_963550 [compost metagenome]